MIPAILAAPAVGSVVSGVVGGVMNAIAPSAPPASSAPSFDSYIGRVATPPRPAQTSHAGMLHGEQLQSMNPTDAQAWANGLTGHHVDATDSAGRTITGTVNGTQMLGHTLALNIGGHLVSVSQLKQISWSPATV